MLRFLQVQHLVVNSEEKQKKTVNVFQRLKLLNQCGINQVSVKHCPLLELNKTARADCTNMLNALSSFTSKY